MMRASKGSCVSALSTISSNRTRYSMRWQRTTFPPDLPLVHPDYRSPHPSPVSTGEHAINSYITPTNPNTDSIQHCHVREAIGSSLTPPTHRSELEAPACEKAWKGLDWLWSHGCTAPSTNKCHSLPASISLFSTAFPKSHMPVFVR